MKVAAVGFIDDREIEVHTLAMIDRTLPKSAWSHAGHFAAALWLLRHRPHLTAPDEIRRLLMRYNEATGTPNTDTGGYHHTITLASMRAGGAYLRGSDADAPIRDVHGGLMISPFGHPDWVLSYWHRDTLFSVAARRDWVEPDLAALPF